MKKPWISEIVRKRNLEDNPAKRPEARAKIAAARRGKPTTLGLPCPDDKKAKISLALKDKPTGRKPTPEVAAKFAEAGRRDKRGEKNPHWRGGITGERQAEYHNPEYLAFVNGVLQRDNYTCQNCGARNGNGRNILLQAHHIKSYAEYPELRYDIDNGMTLCFACHNLTKGKRPKSVEPVPQERLCQWCGLPFRIFNPHKYCPDCRARYCCPVCGSTKCRHTARRLLLQASLVLA